MLLSEIKNVVKAMINNNLTDINLCLEGHQGIGKTQVLKQVAEECGWNYVAIYCAQTSTEDLLGMPKQIDLGNNEYETTYAKPVLFPKKENTIFVLEEINRAPLEVQQAVLQLLTDKKIGNHILPKNTLICCCINPTNSIYQTQELDSVFLNRMVKLNVETSTREFIEYAKTKNAHPDIIRFINSLNSEETFIYFTRVPDEQSIGEPLPSPRAWMLANSILQLERTISEPELYSMMSGALGKTCALKFLGTKDKLDTLIDVKSVLNDFHRIKNLDNVKEPVLYKLVKDLSEVLISNASLAELVTQYPYAVENVGLFIEHLCKERKALVTVLFSRINPTINTTLSVLIEEYQEKHSVNLYEMISEIFAK